MISWILAGVALLLGLKAFTSTGIPITKDKRVNGVGGKVLGVVCLVLAFVLARYGVLAFVDPGAIFGQ